MDRWVEGKMEKGEQPFDNLEQEDNPEEDQREPPKSKEMRKAEGTAAWEVRRLGPDEWKQFLNRARNFLNLDEEQYAKGQKLLKEYRDRAESLMTDEWKEQIRKNRIKHHFRRELKDQSIAPWIYHLDREYNELAKPVKELGSTFRREVMALATDQQRQDALAELQEFADKHGMTPDEMDSQTLHLAGKQN